MESVLIVVMFFIFRRQILGKDLSGLGLKELQQLEQLLNEGLLSLKDKKVSLRVLL